MAASARGLTAPPRWRRSGRWRRAAVALAVVVAHGVGWWAIGLVRVRVGPPPPREPVFVAIRAAPPSVAQRRAISQAVARVAAVRLQPASPITAPPPTIGLEDAPARPAAPTEAGDGDRSQGAPASTGAGAAPLDLSLPRSASAPWRTRNPALQTQAGRRAPVTVESRLATALAGGPWAEERVDNDTLRLRRGGQCIVLRRSRTDAIDPFTASNAMRPWTASAPSPC